MTNFYIRTFPPPLQTRLNQFGAYFDKKCGNFPRTLYTLMDIDDLLAYYQRFSSKFYIDPQVKEYWKFFNEALEFGETMAKHANNETDSSQERNGKRHYLNILS